MIYYFRNNAISLTPLAKLITITLYQIWNKYMFNTDCSLTYTGLQQAYVHNEYLSTRLKLIVSLIASVVTTLMKFQSALYQRAQYVYIQNARIS